MWFEKFVIKYTAFSSTTIQLAKNKSISSLRKKLIESSQVSAKRFLLSNHTEL